MVLTENDEYTEAVLLEGTEEPTFAQIQIQSFPKTMANFKLNAQCPPETKWEEEKIEAELEEDKSNLKGMKASLVLFKSSKDTKPNFNRIEQISIEYTRVTTQCRRH